MLSTVWNTQRGSQSSTEKRRGRKNIEVSRGRDGGEKGEPKGERPVLPMISSLSVLHSLEHPKTVTEISREGGGKR